MIPKQDTLMQQILSDPSYKGKHVIVVAGQVFTAKTGDGAAKILTEIDEKYPQETPQIAYIPDADTLIFSSDHASYFSDKPFVVS